MSAQAVAAPASGSAGETAAARRRRSFQLPAPRRVLGATYAVRLVVAGILFAVAAWEWRAAAPELTLAVSLAVLGAGAFTTISFWYTHLLRREPRTNFLYLQVLFDTFLITWLIHVSGGLESYVAPLYFVVILAAAIVLPFLGGILIAMLASVLFFAAGVWGVYVVPEGELLLRIALFASVALLIGYLADRYRQTGKALGEIEAELQLLRLDTNDVLTTLSTGVLTVDGDGRLVYINPAASAMLSLAPDLWLAKPVLDQLDRASPGLGWLIAHSLKQHIGITGFETGDLIGGSSVLSVSTTLLEGSAHEPRAVTAMLQDVTERRRLDALERRAERLEAVAELSASLAHEIKNPLASIRSAVEQLTGDRIDADDSRILHGLVVRESDRLSRLLSEFLDFARVEVASPEPLDFRVIVGHAVQLVRAHPEAEGSTVVFRAPPREEELTVHGAEDLLHRAVLNLVLNAVQWSGAGGRTEVAIESVASDILAPAAGPLRVVRLTVSDSGPGVPAELVEHIFDPFVTRRPGGTGLGLALVQRAAEAHGGAVFVDPGGSTPGKGATFILYLPTSPPAEIAAAGGATAKEQLT